MTSVPWITDEATGFAQRVFKATCMDCKYSFDREVSITGEVLELLRKTDKPTFTKAMRVRRFCEDAVRVRKSPEDTFLA